MFTLILSFLNINFVFCDAPRSWQVGPQDPATPIMEGMIFFHNYLMFFMILIGMLVFYMLFTILALFNEKKNRISNKFTHSSLLEIIWTILPAVVLLLIAIPSFTLLYSLDELVNPAFTLKIIGHQWYWTYEYPMDEHEIYDVEYDAYMIPTAELEYGKYRLLETDNHVFLPINTHIRLLVTSSDVIHSWAVPSFGIKIDGTPGRLTQGSLFIKRTGAFYGQCSEICGVNHAFMPITISARTVEGYNQYMKLIRGICLNAKGYNIDLEELFRSFVKHN